jgi:hypothetical protein
MKLHHSILINILILDATLNFYHSRREAMDGYTKQNMLKAFNRNPRIKISLTELWDRIKEHWKNK